MPVLDKFDNMNQKLCFLIEWVGVIGILLMMVITCVDVIGAKTIKMPVPGALDIVMISQLMAMAFAIGASLLLGRHVEVEFFVPLLPKPLQIIIEIFIHLLLVALFIVITWRLFAYGYDLQTGHEVSPTIRIPLYGFAYAAGASCIPVCLVYLHRLFTSIARIFEK